MREGPAREGEREDGGEEDRQRDGKGTVQLHVLWACFLLLRTT